MCFTMISFVTIRADLISSTFLVIIVESDTTMIEFLGWFLMKHTSYSIYYLGYYLLNFSWADLYFDWIWSGFLIGSFKVAAESLDDFTIDFPMLSVYFSRSITFLGSSWSVFSLSLLEFLFFWLIVLVDFSDDLGELLIYLDTI